MSRSHRTLGLVAIIVCIVFSVQGDSSVQAHEAPDQQAKGEGIAPLELVQAARFDGSVFDLPPVDSTNVDLHDSVGDAGPNHYVQATHSSLIWTRFSRVHGFG